MFVVPKFGLAMGPHSAFACVLFRSQSGMPLPLLSVHVRDVLFAAATIPLARSEYAVVTACTNRPTVNLRAVLPLPKRSYASPMRGLTSHHAGAFSTAGNDRAGE